METKKNDKKGEEAKANSQDEPEATESEARGAEGVKWQAALAYLPLVCLIPLFLNRDNPFIQRHAKQGFLLFIVVLLALILRIDAVWNLIIIICLAAAVVGAVGILIRGEIKIPFLSDLAERIHI